MIGQIIRTEGKRFRECHTSNDNGSQYVVTWGDSFPRLGCVAIQNVSSVQSLVGRKRTQMTPAPNFT